MTEKQKKLLCIAAVYNRVSPSGLRESTYQLIYKIIDAGDDVYQSERVFSFGRAYALRFESILNKVLSLSDDQIPDEILTAKYD